MKLCAVLAISFVAQTAAADVTIIDNHKAMTVDCAKDKQVNLVGNHIKVSLTGACVKVSITGNHATVSGSVTTAFVAGNHNALELDAVDQISVAGNYNTVTYKRPLAKKKVSVANSGRKNSITRGK